MSNETRQQPAGLRRVPNASVVWRDASESKALPRTDQSIVAVIDAGQVVGTFGSYDAARAFLRGRQ
jgi:hypothetical protein